MNSANPMPLSPGRRIGFAVLNVLLPGLGLLLKREYKMAAFNFIGFLLFVFLFPFMVGHENQAAVPYGYGLALLASGFLCWGEPA